MVQHRSALFGKQSAGGLQNRSYSEWVLCVNVTWVRAMWAGMYWEWVLCVNVTWVRVMWAGMYWGMGAVCQCDLGQSYVGRYILGNGCCVSM